MVWFLECLIWGFLGRVGCAGFWYSLRKCLTTSRGIWYLSDSWMLEQASQVVVGRSARSSWFRFIGPCLATIAACVV